MHLLIFKLVIKQVELIILSLTIDKHALLILKLYFILISDNIWISRTPNHLKVLRILKV